MNSLSATELKVLNNLSKVQNSSVALGDKIQSLIDVSGKSGTPVNAVNSTVTLSVTGVCIDGETFSIGSDTYEFLADDAQTKTADTNIGVNIVAKTEKATVTLTVDTQPTSGDTMVLDAKTYIFVPVGTANHDGEISIGTTLAEAQAAIVAAINGSDNVNTKHPSVSAAAFATNACVITANIGGTSGNTIASTETFAAATNVFSGVKLSSGTNCTAANTATAIIAAINGNTNSKVSAAAGTGNNVTVTAKTAGQEGNSISVSETMANASFGTNVVSLSGGVDGTVAPDTQFYADTSYLYVCVGGNSVSGKNWRRVSLGAAY